MIVILILLLSILFINGLWVVNKLRVDRINDNLIKAVRDADNIFGKLLRPTDLEELDIISKHSRIVIETWRFRLRNEK